MRSLTLLFLSLFLVGSVFAQNTLKLGLRVSPLITTANVTDSVGSEVSGLVSSKFGGSFGLMADFYFTENYGIHTGVHIVSKGLKRDGNVLVNDSTQVAASQNVSITTVEIPIALKLKTGPISGSDWCGTGLFGVTADITASSSNQWTGVNPVNYSLSTTSGTLQSQARLVTPVNISFIFGGGAEYDFGDAGTGYIGFVYHRGLTNMNRRRSFNENTAGNSETYTIGYFSLDFGYYFN